ncbi:hypothetical protein B0J12DRAFT_698998 [Macrophomina phaseolina]|uniref:Uncharacterized protein n=1 Tax=Macrophomina phaseolina TaxID=35725 RepID=A0ABQ8GG93_9PEZI|nr:hypothetical protein B0J12DRAFT_698998 [Macrophomina phaseolina]
MVVCHMVITPNPRTTSCERYFVKFGDGSSRSEFLEYNPDHAYEENRNAPSDYQRLIPVTPGKWLEYIHIKLENGVHVDLHAATTWHILSDNVHDGSTVLKDCLCMLLDHFPRWNNWGDDGLDDDAGTNSFEEIADLTWTWNREDAAARFIT